LVKNNPMKKTILFLALIIILTQTVKAKFDPKHVVWVWPQINWQEYMQISQNDPSSNSTELRLIVALHNTEGSYWDSDHSKALYKSLSKDSLYLLNRPKNIFAITTFENHIVHFLLYGINNKNKNEYEFRVLSNQYTIRVPWSDVSLNGTMSLPDGYKTEQITYLGGYVNQVGNNLIVDVKKKGTTKIILSVVVEWGSLKPVLLNIYSANELNDFLSRLKRPGTYQLSLKEKSKWKLHYSTNQLDANTFLPKKLKAASADNNLIFYLKANINSKDQVEYALVKDDKVLRSWGMNEFDNSFIWLKNLKPGEYLLKMRYSIQRKNVTEYPFVIETPWFQSAIFNMIAGILTLAFLGGTIFLILFLKQKKKTLKELAKKEKLQLELKSIYAQLNPHFVFNALSSIQGLINKKDIEGANMYLSDFAKLMRDSMTNNNKEQTSLNEEIITLETYLKLEQLRFGFKFEIKTNNVNIYETEIPSLLLQPLIENAVKHGVSSLKEEGYVNLLFSKANNDMVVEIQDNGAGFDIKEVGSGYGLKLTRDRIKLLNQIMNGQSIELYIKENTPSGTIVSLQFKNWFL